MSKMAELEYETRMAAEPKFAETYCSQCGQNLGPGDSGVSDCRDHASVENHYKLVEARCEELVNFCNKFQHLSNSYEVMAAEAALERLFRARKKAGGDK